MSESTLAAPASVPPAQVLEQFFLLSSDVMGVLDPQGRVVRANPALLSLLGVDGNELIGHSLLEFVHEDDRTAARALWEGGPLGSPVVSSRLQQQRRSWVTVEWHAAPNPEAPGTLLVGRDTTQRRHTAQVERGQRTVLEAIAGGAPLSAVLTAIVQFVESEAPEVLCTVLTLDEDGKRMSVAAAPSLPAQFNARFEGLEVDAEAGSCGSAIHRRERVIVADVDTHPLWTRDRDLARGAGLRACWSEPILGPHGEPLGALAMYARVPRGPSEAELTLLHASAGLAAIAMSSRRAADQLELAYEAMAHLTDIVLITKQQGPVEKPGKILFVNAAFERTLGYTRADIAALKPGMVAEWVADPTGAIERRRRVRAGEMVHSRVQLRRRSGEIIEAESDVVPIFDAQGKVTHSLTILRDLTQRLEAEAELRRTQSIFRAILDAAPLAVWSADRGGRITMAEGAAIQSMGLEGDTVVGTNTSAWFAGVQLVDASGRVYVADELTELVRERGERVSGTAVWRGQHWQVALGPLRAPDGTLDGLVCVGIVISDRVKLEEQLRHAQKMEAVGRLAGGVAHDFNNVLTAILGFATVALEEVPESSGVGEGLIEIIAATRRAGDLTKRLLIFSKQQVLQPRTLSLNDVVASCEKLLSRLIGEDVHLRSVHAEPEWLVRGDPSQLEQVVMNLAVNARDAMPYGGSLAIVTSNVTVTPKQRALDAAVPVGDWVMLSVSDTGVGMDDAVLSRIYEPFFTTKAPGRGSGLGLSTVYGIVAQSGGHVHVHSVVGEGTTFRVYLPRQEGAVSRAVTPAPRTRPGSGTETVLIAEDDRGVRDLIRLALSRFGYKTLVAASGEEALAIAAAHEGPLPILVTDVVMPRMSGPQLRDRLLAIRPETRVLFLSGYTDDEMIKRGVLEDGVQFLQKPFPPEALARKVRDVLDAP